MNEDEKNAGTVQQAPGAVAEAPAAEAAPPPASKAEGEAPKKVQKAAPKAEGASPAPAAKADGAEPAADGKPAAPADPETTKQFQISPKKKNRKRAAKKGSGKAAGAADGKPAKQGSAGAAKARDGQAFAKPAPKPAAKAPAEAPQDAAQPDPERERRLVEMTRTVQVSVEQLLARMEEEQAQAAAAAPDPAAEEPETPDLPKEPPRSLGARIGFGVLHGVLGMLRWLLLVVLFVAIIAAVGIYLLWRSASEEMLPQLEVTFNGEPLQVTAYDWRVPVVNDLLTRPFTETLLEVPAPLKNTLEGNFAELTVAPAGFESELTIWDSKDKELFTGTVQQFQRYTFAENGSYHGTLVLRNQPEGFVGSSEVTGSQTYDFTFNVSVRPVLTLDKSLIHQGETVALMVNGLGKDDVPMLITELDGNGFIQTERGWVTYLPIAWNQAPGAYTLQVHTQDYVLETTLNVRAQEWDMRDYSDRSRLVTPYLGADQTPTAVTDLLNIYDDTAYWAKGGFAEPFADSKKFSVTLDYGTTEYVGRSASQRANGEGNGRTATNVVLGSRRGQELLAPAAGRVLLAKTLEPEQAGNTVVVEHGGGIKSIFYGLETLDVKSGDIVKQGQVLGTTGSRVIGEVRVHNTPVEPMCIWRGESNALRCY